MATSNGYAAPSLTFLTEQGVDQDSLANVVPSKTTDILDLAYVQAVTSIDTTPTLDDPSVETIDGFVGPSMGEYWFNRVHIIPKAMNFGNILGSISNTVEVYNAHLSSSKQITAVNNNAGAGLTLPGLPAMPITLDPQKGRTFTILVTTNGVPSFDTTVDFVTTDGTLFLGVSGSRVIIFPFRPELPVNERLEFLTDIMEKMDGSEQRVACRTLPRIFFDLDVFREYGDEYERLEMLLYGWQHRVFGLPMWHEPSFTTSAVAAGATVIPLNSTANGSLKVGGLAMLYTDETTYTALQVASMTSNSITFSSPIDRDYAAGTEVYPLRTALCGGAGRGARRKLGAANVKLSFQCTDNAPDLASTSGWSTYSSKVLLDGPNAVDGDLSEVFERRLIIVDGGTGVVEQDSPWAAFRRSSAKTFQVHSRAALWQVRQLLYALRGQQVSFWLPTFNKALTVAQTLNSGTNTMVVNSVGYARFVAAGIGRNVVRIKFTDGTSLVRGVTSAAELSGGLETLTLDANWPTTRAPEAVSQVDFFEKVRWASDSITITHSSSLGDARITGPVKQVLE